MRRAIVAMLTDFGTRDGYVAAMKAVVLKRLRDVEFVDISHEVEPFAIESAAYVLYTVFDFFPPGTVFLCVVDPGVGTARKAVAVEADDKYLVGPDNGLFSWVLKSKAYRAFTLENSSLFEECVSSTFHGRDIFAPVAAYLASGGRIEDVGAACLIAEAPWTDVICEARTVQGDVIHIDRFGNIITSIKKESLPGEVQNAGSFRLLIGDQVIDRIVRTYGDLPEGGLGALWGSFGHLEISVNRGSAARVLNTRLGERVVLMW